MLHILLMILKIIGIIIAVVLGLVLLAAVILLVTPLKYKVDAACGGDLDTLEVHVKYSWLFRLISGWVSYQDKETSWYLKVAWKKFPKASGREETENRKEEEPETAVPSEKPESAAQPEKAEKSEPAMQPKKNEKPESAVQMEKNEKLESSAEPEARRRKRSLFGRIRRFFRKIKYTFRKICDRIKIIGEKKEKVLAFLEHETHRKAFGKIKSELLRLLRFLRPKRIRGRVHFGFEDPGQTGKTLAWLSVFYPFYGEHVILEPDFHEKVLDGELHIQGKVRGIHAVIVCLNLLISKDVRTTYQHIRQLKL